MSSLNISFGSTSSLDDAFGGPRPVAPRKRVSNVQNIPGFIQVASDTLIHIAQQDFWKIGYDQEGPYIECLIEDPNTPFRG